MLSVNTNPGAMIALQNLDETESQLSTTQNQISTGLAVSSAKDDGSTYAIAQNMRSDVAAYSSVTNSLQTGMSSIDVAMSAGQSISDLLTQMKSKALAAADTSIDTASRQALNEDFTALRDQINSIVANAEFNNFNLINGSTTQLSAIASADGTRHVTVGAENMSLSGSIVTIATTSTVSTQAKASAMITAVNNSLENVDSALARLSAGDKKFSVQANFVQTLSGALTTGIGNLVDANMAQESAQLQALQVKQQLGAQALSIANQSPQVILSLFH
jgi:flagellin